MDEQFRRGVVVGLGTYAVWGLLTIYWKLLHRFRAFELIGWRIACAAVVMVVVVSATGGWQTIRTQMRDPALRRNVALASVTLTINWTAYVWAVVHGRVLETALGYFVAPLGTMALGVVVLHERLRRAQIVAITFAVAAIIVLTTSYGRVPWLALAIAVSWSTYGYLKRKVPLSPVNSMAAETLLLAIPAVLLIILMAPQADSVPNSATTGQLVLVLLSGVATVGPLICFAYAAKRLPLTVIGPMQYIVPSINFLLGWLAYDEELTLANVVGFALVWIGLAILTVDMVRNTRPTRRGAAVTRYAGSAS